MSLAKCFAACVATLVLTAHAEPHCPGNVSSLKLRRVQDALIVVRVSINHNGSYDFLVDTGSQITSIDPALASDFHLKIEGTTGVSGVATHSRSAYSHLDLIDAGSSSVPDVLVVVQDLADFRTADSDIRGILGENFLTHFDLLIDNRQQILCLDQLSTLARVVKGERIPLAPPHGPQDDLPFTRPLIAPVRLASVGAAPVLLRLDSGSSALLLYNTEPRLLPASANRASSFARVVNGIQQTFAVLPAQDIRVGAIPVNHVPIVVPMNAVGIGPGPREDGLLPTMAFARVFISYSKNYAAFDPWLH
jgi:hypothetical protein